MKNIPIAIKGLFNLLFFGIYSLIGIILGNFLYGLVLNSLGWAVPGSSDPVHMKLAVLILIFIALITVLLRKYFYLSCKIETSKNLPIDKAVSIKKDEKKPRPAREKKQEKIEMKKAVVAEEEGDDTEMKIYVDKEIK